tara:strand:+ start:387 stop:587 length:201 start_codon:yes stop_codon:yes gene_type:complete
MTLKQALTRLHCREDWDEVLIYLAKEREAALMDFQHSDLTDNPHKLAKLAGEIAAIDRVLRVLQND